MIPIHQYLSYGFQLIFLLIIAIFVIKLIMYFKYEKQWDAIAFFHYPKLSLKMTPSKTLRTWRKRQNYLTTSILILGVLLVCMYAFQRMVSS